MSVFDTLWDALLPLLAPLEGFADFTIFFLVIEYIITTLVFGLLYKVVGWANSKCIQGSFGWKGYVILGSVGVIYHELSHMIMAKLFGHKIEEVKLFSPMQGKEDGTLGYVIHSWNNSIPIQRIGNFFIGTAPMFFGAGLLFVALRLAYPDIFVDVGQVRGVQNSLEYVFNNMFQRDNFLSIGTPFVILIMVTICPQMHMSWSDVKGAIIGAVSFIFTTFILSFIFNFMPSNVMYQIVNVLNTFVVYYTHALILGLLTSTAMTASFCPILLIRRKFFKII